MIRVRVRVRGKLSSGIIFIIVTLFFSFRLVIMGEELYYFLWQEELYYFLWQEKKFQKR